MLGRLKIVGAIVAVIGVIAMIGGGFGYMQVQAGADALQGFSKAQNVTLSYNDQGQLVDRGDPEQGKIILSLLKDTWKWPVSQGDLNAAEFNSTSRDEIGVLAASFTRMRTSVVQAMKMLEN